MVPRMSRKVTVDDDRFMPRLIGFVFSPMHMSEGCQHECQHQGKRTNKGGGPTHGLSIARHLRNRQPPLHSSDRAHARNFQQNVELSSKAATTHADRILNNVTMYFQ